jgi:hypothetical protein
MLKIKKSGSSLAFVDNAWRNLALYILGICSIAVLVFDGVQYHRVWAVNLEISSIAHLNGKAWYATVANPIPTSIRWLFEIPSDTLSSPKSSTVYVFDDKGKLGPAHSLHKDIAILGGGRFSYWRGALRFSTRDNQQPNKNVNAIGIKVVAAPALYPIYTWLAVIITLYICLIIISRFIRTASGQSILITANYCVYNRVIGWLTVFIFGCILYGHLLITLPKGILTFNDTHFYLLFLARTPVGYSLFIHSIIYLLGSPYYIVLIQFSLAICAITYFCKEIEWHFSTITALTIGVLLVLKGDTDNLNYSALTDSLAFSIILTMSGLCLRYARSKRTSTIIIMVILLNVATTIRPALLFMMFLIVAITLYYYPISRKGLIISIIGCSMAFFSNAALQPLVARYLERSDIDHYLNNIWPTQINAYHTEGWLKKSRESDPILGEIILSQIRFSITANQRTEFPLETREIAAKLSKLREAFNEAKSWQSKYAIFAENHGGLIDQALEKLHPEILSSSDGYLIRNRYYNQLAIETLRDHPSALIKISWIKLLYEIHETLVGSWQGEYNIQSLETIGSRYWEQRYGLSPGPFNMTRSDGIQKYIDVWIHPLLPIMFLMTIGYCIVYALFLFRMLEYKERFFLLSVFGLSCFTYTMMICVMARPLYRYGMHIAPMYLFILIGTIELLLRRMNSIVRRYWYCKKILV